MPQTYLPARESELVTWTGEFLANIQAAPADYGLTAQDATNYATTRTNFVTAYNATQNPLTRTPPNFAAKSAAKKTLVNATRMLVDQAQAWPQMTNEKRRALKITERGKKPTPSPVPGTSPFVIVEKVDGRVVSLRFQGSKSNRARPKGVAGVSVFSFYGEQPPTEASGWTYENMTGRTTMDLALDRTTDAGTVWLCAFWFNSRKESGLASAAVSVNLAAATVTPQVAKKLKIAA